MDQATAGAEQQGPRPPLCEKCHHELRQLLDDWERLSWTFRLDDETAVAGVIVATVDALRKCQDAEHQEKQS